MSQRSVGRSARPKKKSTKPPQIQKPKRQLEQYQDLYKRWGCLTVNRALLLYIPQFVVSIGYIIFRFIESPETKYENLRDIVSVIEYTFYICGIYLRQKYLIIFSLLLFTFYITLSLYRLGTYLEADISSGNNPFNSIVQIVEYLECLAHFMMQPIYITITYFALQEAIAISNRRDEFIVRFMKNCRKEFLTDTTTSSFDKESWWTTTKSLYICIITTVVCKGSILALHIANHRNDFGYWIIGICCIWMTVETIVLVLALQNMFFSFILGCMCASAGTIVYVEFLEQMFATSMDSISESYNYSLLERWIMGILVLILYLEHCFQILTVARLLDDYFIRKKLDTTESFTYSNTTEEEQ